MASDTFLTEELSATIEMIAALSLVIRPHTIKSRYLAEQCSGVAKAFGPKSW
jgi:hypothetical protein